MRRRQADPNVGLHAVADLPAFAKAPPRLAKAPKA
jgi:hypothetical protein